MSDEAPDNIRCVGLQVLHSTLGPLQSRGWYHPAQHPKPINHNQMQRLTESEAETSTDTPAVVGRPGQHPMLVQPYLDGIPTQNQGSKPITYIKMQGSVKLHTDRNHRAATAAC